MTQCWSSSRRGAAICRRRCRVGSCSTRCSPRALVSCPSSATSVRYPASSARSHRSVSAAYKPNSRSAPPSPPGPLTASDAWLLEEYLIERSKTRCLLRRQDRADRAAAATPSLRAPRSCRRAADGRGRRRRAIRRPRPARPPTARPSLLPRARQSPRRRPPLRRPPSADTACRPVHALALMTRLGRVSLFSIPVTPCPSAWARIGLDVCLRLFLLRR